MTLLAVTTVLAVWCFAGTVVGLLLCQAVRWAHSLEVPPEPAAATAPAPAVPAPRTTGEQLDVTARDGSGQLVGP